VGLVCPIQLAVGSVSTLDASAAVSQGLAPYQLLLAVLWLRAFDRIDDPPRQQKRPIDGMRFSLVLMVSGLAFLACSVVLSDLAILAWKQPFSLSHWQSTGHSMASEWKALLPIQLAIAGVSLCRPQLRRWVAVAMGFALVLVVSRAWGVWSLAWLIPDEGLREPLLGTDLSFGLGRFSAIQLGLELLVLSGTFTTAHAVWGRVTVSPHLSDWSMPALGNRSYRWLSIGVGTNLAWCGRSGLVIATSVALASARLGCRGRLASTTPHPSIPKPARLCSVGVRRELHRQRDRTPTTSAPPVCGRNCDH
jgi:hypothetical protein